MTIDKLDSVIKVSFATMVLGVAYDQVAPEPSAALALFLWVVGMGGVAIAGFWRARLVRNARTPRAMGSAPMTHPAARTTTEPLRSERLRDIGLVSFLLGLFVLNVAFFVAFVSRPAPNIAIAGAILTALGALALATRYRFVAVLVACFVAPAGFIWAFVIWPPVFWVLPVIAFVWSVARLWRRAHPRPIS